VLIPIEIIPVIMNIGIVVITLFTVKTLVYTFLYLYFYDPNNDKDDKNRTFKKKLHAFLKRMFPRFFEDTTVPPPNAGS
jgi:hypothetical protein